MFVLAHVLGVPVEEYALPWLGGAGAGLMTVLAFGLRSLTLKRRGK